MTKLAFYALYEPRADVDERASGLLEPLPREVSEQRLQALLDAHFTADSAAPAREAPVSVRTTSSSRRRRWRAVVNVGSVLALAAAVLLVWLLQRPHPAPELETMPGFSVEAHETRPDAMREAGSGDVRCPVHRGNAHALVLCLIPALPIDGALAVAAYAEPEGGEGRWLTLEHIEQSDEGVVVIEEPIATLGLSPGRWKLTFYVTHESRRTGVAIVETELELGPGSAP